MDLLRLATAGSVDDGKSTLIGRLLYDSKSIFTDQLTHLEDVSRRRGLGATDLALLTDGLRAEREQGITIDVAYRYFSTPRRRFVLADTPGHPQYTRNMVTGASTANLALVLVDARNGILEQTRRHAFLATLLRVPHIVLCVNKMDLVEHSQERFNEIRDDFAAFAAKLDIGDLSFIPVSALNGDNIVSRSVSMPWYEGPSLLHHLEEVHIASDRNLVDVRFPVQYVIRPRDDEHHDYRGYAGQVAGGVLQVGDTIEVLPSGMQSTISHIDTPDGPAEQAFAPMSVVVRLADNIDVSRGDLICRPQNQPVMSQTVEGIVCWMSASPTLQAGGRYLLKHTHRWSKAIVRDLKYRIDINTMHRDEGVESLGLNDIGRVTLRLAQPIFADEYRRNRTTGSFILVDEATNNTVGAGIITAAS